MALFNIGKKKKPAPKPKQAKPATKLLWSKTFPQSGSFKGFRRIRLGRYYEDIDASLQELKKSRYNMKGRTIRLDNIASTDPYNKYKVIKVYVDDKLIGNVFESDAQQYSMLTDYEYDKAHVRVEDTALDVDFDTSGIVTTKVYLFLHYPKIEPIKVTIE